MTLTVTMRAIITIMILNNLILRFYFLKVFKETLVIKLVYLARRRERARQLFVFVRLLRFA